MTAPLLIWLPGAADTLEHAVADADVVHAGAAGLGQVVAVCSASVVLCSLATPAARRCPECDAHVSRDREPQRERGFLERLRRTWGRPSS